VAFLLNLVERLVDDALGNRLLAVLHYLVDEPAKINVVEFGFGYNRASFCSSATCHSLIPFTSVFASSSFSPGDARRIESAANYVISDSGKVLDATTAYQDDRVLLQVVAFARNVSRHFHAVGKSDSGYLAQGGIGLLGSLRSHLNTDAPLLRRAGIPSSSVLERVECIPKRRRFVLLALRCSALPNKLINGGHNSTPNMNLITLLGKQNKVSRTGDDKPKL
jgi:hypothetical protein